MFKFKKKRTEAYNYIIAKEQPFAVTTEALQKAIINLEYTNVDGNYKVIQFTSATSGEGKTTTVANLAYLLGSQGKKVLVIDLDLRKPKLQRVFDVPNSEGLNDYLLDKLDFEDLIQHCEHIGVDYILSGQKTTSVTNVLTSEKLKTLLKQLREQYDYVLVDGPPVLAVSDPLYLAKITDGIIAIVAQNKTVKKAVKSAFAELKQVKAPVIGTIMTQIKANSKGYSSYYSYYGEE